MNDKYVAVPREDWEGILDSVRGKTGKTALLKSGEVSPEIDGIKGGGTVVGKWRFHADGIEQIPPPGEINVKFTDLDGIEYDYMVIDVSDDEWSIGFYRHDGGGSVAIIDGYLEDDYYMIIDFGATPQPVPLEFVEWLALAATTGGFETEGGGEIDDGNTHIFIELEESRREIRVGLGLAGTVEIDYGDGSPVETMTAVNALSSITYSDDHKYPSGGSYEIVIKVISGTACVNGNTRVSKLIAPGTSERVTADSTYFCSTIRRVVLGSNIYVSSYGFKRCYGLEQVTIGEEAVVRSIGTNAFEACHSLTSVKLPRNINDIGANAFDYCASLASIELPDGVKAIGNYAFYNNNSLTRIVIPETVKSIGNSAFKYCYSLKECIVNAQTPPTLGTTAFADTPADLLIIVPSNQILSYTAATNWAAMSDYLVGRSKAAYVLPDGITVNFAPEYIYATYSGNRDNYCEFFIADGIDTRRLVVVVDDASQNAGVSVDVSLENSPYAMLICEIYVDHSGASAALPETTTLTVYL